MMVLVCWTGGVHFPPLHGGEHGWNRRAAGEPTALGGRAVTVTAGRQAAGRTLSRRDTVNRRERAPWNMISVRFMPSGRPGHRRRGVPCVAACYRRRKAPSAALDDFFRMTRSVGQTGSSLVRAVQALAERALTCHRTVLVLF